MSKIALMFASLLALSQGASASDQSPRFKVADLAGEWTRCVAWSGGAAFNIVNGSGSRDRCFQLAKVCTGNPNAKATYYTPAVVINAPYQRCVAN